MIFNLSLGGLISNVARSIVIPFIAIQNQNRILKRIQRAAMQRTETAQNRLTYTSKV